MKDLKEKIVSEAIIDLQKDGLRFSVDSLAVRLKVSKKTIYKCYATKEELALDIYDRFYRSAADDVADAETGDAYELLKIYFKSFCLVSDGIFNKFALNNSIKTFAVSRHDAVWTELCNKLNVCDDSIRLIVDGAFSKLVDDQQLAERVLRRLAALIC